MRRGDPFHYYSAVFPMRNYGYASRCPSGNGKFRCSYDPVHYRNSRNQSGMDLLGVPKVQILVCFVYFISGILGHYHIASGDLFLYGKKKGSQYDPWSGRTVKYIKNRQSPMWCRGLFFCGGQASSPQSERNHNNSMKGSSNMIDERFKYSYNNPEKYF